MGFWLHRTITEHSLRSLATGLLQVCVGSKKRGSQSKSRKSSPTSDRIRSTSLQERPRSLWASRPVQVAGPGMEESPRKFAGAIRKYLLLYLKVQ